MKQKLSILIISLLILVFALGCEKETEPDTTPPQVSISSPINGASVRDSVIVKATVADNDGISDVVFLVDGESKGTVSSAPFELIWDTKQETNGSHNLQCKATDNSDNTALSDIVTVTVSNYLFKATFTNNWVSPDEQCIIFISDMNGNMLAEKTFSGNKSFEMFLDSGLSKSTINDITKICVTTVTGNADHSNITTNMNIPVGSSWTWKGHPSSQIDYDNPYTVELNFQNMPEHSSYMISTKWNGRSSTRTLYSPYNFDFYKSPQDIYIKLNTVNNGVQYYWLNAVVSGSRQVDLSLMNNSMHHTINFPGNSIGYYKSLYGVANPGNRYEGKYWIDYERDSENQVNSIDVYYPETSFTDYNTKLSYYDDNNRDEFWYQSIYGVIPDDFIKINADFDFVSTSYGNFEISTTGEFIQTRSSWKDENYNYWSLYGDKTVKSYKLPNFPNSVIQLFGLNRESFTLRYADLIDYSSLTSYSEVLDILFNSDNYFYDVVNDLRSRVKYYNDGGLLKQTNNIEDIYEEPYLIR